MKRSFFATFLVASAFSFPVFTAHADTPEKPKAKIEIVNKGELRLDGKIVMLSGQKEWQLKAMSWTSPAEVTTEFDEPKDKVVVLNDQTYIHPRGEEEKVSLAEIKISDRVAIIGKNQPNGSILAREIVMLEGYGQRKMVGVLPTNSTTLVLVEQSRAARERGEISKAISLIQEGISAAQGQGDATGEALATHDLGLLYRDSDQDEKALETFDREVSIGNQIGNAMVQTLGLSGGAHALVSLKRYDDALERLENANRTSATLEPKIRIGVVGTLANLYLLKNRKSEAIALLNTTYQLEDQAGEPDDATETMLTLVSLQAKSDPTTARELLKTAELRMAAIRNLEYKPRLLTSKGVGLYKLGDKEAAQAAFDEAVQLYTEAGKQDAADRVKKLSETFKKAGDIDETTVAITDETPTDGQNKDPNTPDTPQ